MPRPTDGGPAFPNQQDNTPGHQIYDGMSLRDWLAGQALAGSNWTQWRVHMPGAGPHVKRDISENCYALADAMLAERGRTDGN